MNIVVLAGGTSSERVVSISSGTEVTKALRGRGHRAVLTDVFLGTDRVTGNIGEDFPEEYDVEAAAAAISAGNDRVAAEAKTRRAFFGPGVLRLCEEADTVFMALHGANGEDGRVQAAFDLLGIHYTGSNYLGSALAMDKEMTKKIFREEGVPTPKGIVVRKGKPMPDIHECGVGLPCVVKPCRGGSSVGVSIARTDDEYAQALAEGFAYEDVLIVEQYIAGREFSVGIVDGEAYPVIEIAPIKGFYNYENKYKAGSTIETCPAQLDEELTKKMQKTAAAAYRALGLSSYGRIDIMMDGENRMYCLEANTLPGMTPTSLLPQEAAAIGMDFGQLCEKLIAVSVREEKR